MRIGNRMQRAAVSAFAMTLTLSLASGLVALEAAAATEGRGGCSLLTRAA